MTNEQEQQMLEQHQGNAWRMLDSYILRLPISDKEKAELQEAALDYGQAIFAMMENKLKRV